MSASTGAAAWSVLRVGLAALVAAGLGCGRDDRAAGPSATVAHPSGPGALEPARTFAVIAGVLSFRDTSLRPFSPHHRKDQELYDVLAARGVPRGQMTLLLDERATRSAILAALGDVSRRAGAGSTLLFYYAGHGLKGDDGNAYFASYDVSTANPKPTGLPVASIAPGMAAFRGKRVLLLADACYSGALGDTQRALAARGLEVAALTSAEASNVSTGNWTFTQTVLDALRGDPLADRDGGGTVTLGELAGEVADAMKFRERQRHGFSASGLASTYVLAGAARRPAAGGGPFAIGHYVSARRGGSSSAARVRRGGPERSLVRFYSYSDSEDVEVANRDLAQITFGRHPAGKAVRVLWKGTLYDAKVTRADGDFHFITYPGYPSYWDEWVMSDRIAASGAEAVSEPAKKRVSVEWHGRWYPAVVLKRVGDQALIHYEGFESSWDEWVGKERLRE